MLYLYPNHEFVIVLKKQDIYTRYRITTSVDFFQRGGYVWIFFLLSKEKIDILKPIKIKILKTYTKHTNIKEIHPKTFTWGNHDHD